MTIGPVARRVAFCVVLAITIVTGPWAPGGAQTSEPGLTLVDQTAFVGPSGTFRVDVSTRDLPTGSRLTLTVHQAVESRSHLERTMVGDQLGSTVMSTTVAASGTSSTALLLPVSATWPAPVGGAVLSTAGVYPVTIEAIRTDGSRVARLITQLVRLPAAATPTDPLEVGTIVSIDATPEVDRAGSTTLSDADADRAREQLAIVEERTAAGGPSLALTASPYVLATLRETGTSVAPPTSRLTVLSQPWVSIDAGSLTAGGHESTVVDEFTVGDSTLRSVFGSAPVQRIAVIDGSTSPRVLDLAAARGTQSVVVGSAQLRSLTPGDTSAITQRFTITSQNDSSFMAIASDDVAVVPFVYGNDPVLAAHQAIAELAMLHFEQPGSGRGIALDLPATTAPAGLRELLDGLSRTDGADSGSTGAAVLAPVSLDELFSSTTVATDRNRPVVRDRVSDETVGIDAWSAAFDEATWNLRGLRTLLPDGDELVAPVDRTILTSAERSLTTPDRLAVLAGAERSIRELAAAISLPATQRVTLTSRSGEIPLTIENALPTDAHVRITTSSPKLDFPEGSTIDLVLPPGTTRTSMQVTTRASGAFPMQVSIVSADGVLPVASSRIDVRSTAISGWGLVLSVGAGLFLAVWWIRHFRHTRRARSLIDVDGAETGSPTSR